MRTTYCLLTAILGLLLLMGCQNFSEAAAAPETRDALAPTGKLRVGILASSSIHATSDAAGELKGVAVDLGKEMARRIGVPFEPVAYTSLSSFLAGLKAGESDIAMIGITSEREQFADFTAPYMVVEFSYLVPNGSSISSLANVDRTGVRIAVVEKSGQDAFLSHTIKHAEVIRRATSDDVSQLLRDGGVDAVYGIKVNLLGQTVKLPGFRVLEGQFGGENIAIALPKGRQQNAAYARQFVENAKSEGLVKDAIEKAGLRGVVVAPIQ